jgi:hypothetical protein
VEVEGLCHSLFEFGDVNLGKDESLQDEFQNKEAFYYGQITGTTSISVTILMINTRNA